jgi:hypothetical protein
MEHSIKDCTTEFVYQRRVAYQQRFSVSVYYDEPSTKQMGLYTVTRIDGKLHQPHRVAQTKQSG